MNKIIITILVLFFFSCSDNSQNKQVDNTSTVSLPYYGTYLYTDNDCGGQDIQYATIDLDGIAFFDLLSDGCDDTVECYMLNEYDLIEVSSDTFLVTLSDNTSEIYGEIYLQGDSLFTITYENNNGSIVSYTWEKIKNDIYAFNPICDQEYGNTKNIADMLVYAVDNNGSLLWKNYLHKGLWDLATSVVSLDAGGYIVFGKFDGIEWGGCCYTANYDKRDIIRIDNEGNIVWEKEIEIGNDGVSDYYLDIGSSMIQTSQGHLVVLAPGASGNNRLVISMFDTNGNIIWSKNYMEENLTYNSGNVEIIESLDGNLVLAGGWMPGTITVIDYSSGEIISSFELPFVNARRIIRTNNGYTMLALGESDNVASVGVDNGGNVIWSKIYDDPSTSGPLDIINQDDGGFVIFCYSDPPPYATLIKTDSLGNEIWRKKYDDYIGGGKGSLAPTSDGGYFMGSGYAVTKLDSDFNVDWYSSCSSCFDKYFTNGLVSGINHDMRIIPGGAIFVGYGSSDWE